MSVASRTFTTTVGSITVSHALFYNTDLLGVWREGLEYTEVSLLTVPVGRQYRRVVSSIKFDPNIPFAAGEKVFVIYQTN